MSSSSNMFSAEPLIGIKRHRLLTDGKGVTTLVAFHGCPLSCKYCLNPQCKTNDGVWEYMTPEQLYNHVNVDDIYFQSTGGGIVFGGGEPLLYPDFIIRFSELCKENNWNIGVETTLNIDHTSLSRLLPILDEYIVDVKDMNPMIYKSYTGKDNSWVLNNLKYLVEHGAADKITARIPYIKGYNTKEETELSREVLQLMGVNSFEFVNYWTNVGEERMNYSEQHAGKAVCEVLKRIRLLIADSNGIDYVPEECTHKGDCLGTCPRCEEELGFLTTELAQRKAQGKSIQL